MGSLKNIVFLSKRVAGNSWEMDVISSENMKCYTLELGLQPNIVFLSKRRHGNIVLLSKDYCVPE